MNIAGHVHRHPACPAASRQAERGGTMALTGTERGGMRQAPPHRRRGAPRVVAAALMLLLLFAAAGCDKPGDQGGGTTRERSMASPASTPTPFRPEPMPGTEAARTAPTAPGPSASDGAPR